MKDASRHPWYELAFGKHYLDLYGHRDEEAAAREAAFAVEVLGLRPGRRVLDLSCGPGYHLEALRERGIEGIGLDLSVSLLGCVSPGCEAVRGDMRYLPFRGPFDGALTFYTTLGYFEGEDNRRVLREMARVLRPGGGFLVDHLNAGFVRASLVPRSERDVKERRVLETRWIEEDPARVLKRVEVSRDGAPLHDYTESVRLYGEDELRVALGDAGLSVTKVYGGFDGGPLAPDAPRMILVGQKRI